jgi:hypothetical protein
MAEWDDMEREVLCPLLWQKGWGFPELAVPSNIYRGPMVFAFFWL